MPRRFLALLALSSASVMACSKPIPQAQPLDAGALPPGGVPPAPMLSNEDILPSPASLPPGQTGYAAFDKSELGNGQTSLLFFYAAWDPFSKANSETLAKWYAEQTFPISTYRVEFDAENDLKSRYGVTQQNTFVLIDGQGDAQKVMSFPGEEDLKGLLQG